MNKWKSPYLIYITPVARIYNFYCLFTCTWSIFLMKIGALPALFWAHYIPNIWNNVGHIGARHKFGNKYRSQDTLLLAGWMAPGGHHHHHFQCSMIEYCEHFQSLYIDFRVIFVCMHYLMYQHIIYIIKHINIKIKIRMR